MPKDYRRATPDYEPNPAPVQQQPPCPGKCNASWRAAEKRRADNGKEHPLQPRPGEPTWCPPCTTAIRGALQDMPALAVHLQLEADSGIKETPLGESVSGSHERALHEHQAAVFMIEELAGYLGDWEDTVRSARGLASQRNTDITHTLTVDRSARFLRQHLTWLIAEHPATDVREGFGLDTLAIHRRVQRLVHAEDVEPERCYGVACPYCDYKSLEHELDEIGKPSGYIKCRKCRPILRMSPIEYHRWTKLLAHDVCARGLAPLEKLTEVFGGKIPTAFVQAARSAE